MIIKEKFKDNLVRTYSDKGVYIERDGIQYSEAIDIAEFNYEYTETDIPIEPELYVESMEVFGKVEEPEHEIM
jgi:hypothetical protein